MGTANSGIEVLRLFVTENSQDVNMRLIFPWLVRSLVLLSESSVMGLVTIIQQSKSYVSQGDSIKCFDTIATISEQLDNMWEVYAELGYAYSTLLEKYQEVTKKAE